MENKEFKVVDKRRFTETGEKKGEEEKREDAPEKPSDIPESIPIPPVDFATLLMSLSTSALLHLGEIPDPQSRKENKNLELAKHTIDIIDMLKEKTKGNLTDEETGLLNNILYDLKMRYVNITK